jgi:3-deoxy-7-phosphoheptulonate synthase
MLVVMKNDATEVQVQAVIREIESLGYRGIPMPGAQRTAVCIVGNTGPVEDSRLLSLDGVKETIRVTKPYKLVSRETQYGAQIFRGGAFKPRTSPYSFQGLGEEGLKILKKVRSETGLLIVTEATDHTNIEVVEQYGDIIQIGARNMHNYSLLRRAGRASKPILLKRGFAATIGELLMSAEYIMSEGNTQVILCERGIRTFADNTRSTLDLSAIPSIKEVSHLPVVVDPSHAAGRREYVIPLSKGAIAVGADGLLVEVHHDPSHALSDGTQSLYPEQFEKLMREIESIRR